MSTAAAGIETTQNPAPTSGAGGGQQAPAPPVAAAPAADATPAVADLDIKLPEGWKGDEPLLGGFKTLAKEAGLNGEAATKLVSWYASESTKALEARDKADLEAFTKQGQDWLKELEADKDFGGAKLAQTVADAKDLLRDPRYGGSEAAAVLRQYGLENHPALVKHHARLRALTKEDSSAVEGGSHAAPAKPTEEQQLRKLYPEMFPAASGSP